MENSELLEFLAKQGIQATQVRTHRVDHTDEGDEHLYLVDIKHKNNTISVYVVYADAQQVNIFKVMKSFDRTPPTTP